MPITFSPVQTNADLTPLFNTALPSGVTISNVSLTGYVESAGGYDYNAQSGFFSDGADAVGFDSGILLTTGNGTPYEESEIGTEFVDGPGDADLDSAFEAAFPNYSGTSDANVMTFRVEVTDPSIQSAQLDAVFATESLL